MIVLGPNKFVVVYRIAPLNGNVGYPGGAIIEHGGDPDVVLFPNKSIKKSKSGLFKPRSYFPI